MNFIYKDNKFCINCDWLQFSVMCREANPEFICPDGYRIEFCQGNNIFKDRALVFYIDGQKVLTLLWNPYSKVLKENVMTVQVANEFLYCSDIRESMALVKKIVDCDFNNIGRLDICCDFEMTERRWQFVKHLNSGHYYVGRKKEGSTWWHHNNKDGFKKQELHCLSWGSQKSEIKVKLYNKSREQGLWFYKKDAQTGEMVRGEAEKPWIVENWHKIGLDDNRVWRLEFSLCGASQLRWRGQYISLDEVSNWSWLCRVFFDLFETRFHTRINQGRKTNEHNDDKRVYLFELPKEGEKLEWAENEVLPKESKPAVSLLRSMMRNLDNEVLQCSRPIFESYAKGVIDLVENAKLYNYFKYVFGSDVNEYFESLYNEIGCGIHYHVLPPNKFMD